MRKLRAHQNNTASFRPHPKFPLSKKRREQPTTRETMENDERPGGRRTPNAGPRATADAERAVPRRTARAARRGTQDGRNPARRPITRRNVSDAAERFTDISARYRTTGMGDARPAHGTLSHESIADDGHLISGESSMRSSSSRSLTNRWSVSPPGGTLDLNKAGE